MPTPVQPEVKSDDTPRPSRRPMELVGQREVPEQAGLSQLIASATTTAQTPRKPDDGKFANPQAGEYVHRAMWKAAVMGTLNVLFAVVAARLALLVAIVGAIVLTYITIAAPDPWRLAALGVYTALVVLPATWLASRR